MDLLDPLIKGSHWRTDRLTDYSTVQYTRRLPLNGKRCDADNEWPSLAATATATGVTLDNAWTTLNVYRIRNEKRRKIEITNPTKIGTRDSKYTKR